MSNYVKSDNVWKESIPLSKKATYFEPLDASVYRENDYQIFHGLSKFRAAVSLASQATISFQTNNSAGMRAIRPLKLTRYNGDTLLGEIAINPNQSYVSFPAGEYEVEFELRGGLTVLLNANAAFTAITDLSQYRGSALPILRSSALRSVPTVLPPTVRSLSMAFDSCSNFNQDLSSWDTSRVAYFINTFSNATAFNQPLPWDFSIAEDMGFFLRGCANFNQPLNINSPKVKNLASLLQGCTRFNSDLTIDAPLAESFHMGLSDCASFDKPLILNTPRLNNCSYLFSNCSSFNSQFECNSTMLSSMLRMFSGCTRFNQLPQIDVSNSTNFSYMFYGCSNFNQDISHWDVSKVLNMNYMFQNASKFNQNLSGWNVEAVQYFTGFANGATAFTTENKPSKFR